MQHYLGALIEHHVDSSQLATAGYHAATGTLRVRFKARAKDVPGPVYQYSGVSQQAFEALVVAESVGKHFNAHVKEKYTTAKLTEELVDGAWQFTGAEVIFTAPTVDHHHV